ncbi:MAG TPA: bifunctional 5,10-methylenetetrahydrofolate dehydrogenase/5,10-methenyltetrahydrofolate cyclohydrolase [Syntrophomonadaceae bacterium]|nr:bifunctional 5,10-methylenetetrahydrofolate dehydrogenase/5,10-methenyltetrahydrofolate cyclohydrolase [Syntrophomonadaceae bacterium]
MLIYGRDIRDKIKAQVKDEASKRKLAMTIIQVGAEADSEVYIRNIKKFGTETGVDVTILNLDIETTEEKLIEIVNDLNNDPLVTGIMIQEPLPKHIDSDLVVDCMDPRKDVEGVHNYNLGKLISKQKGVYPSTPKAIVTMIKEFDIPIEGQKVVIVGRSTIVGHPLANMMTAEHGTVTLCHSRTKDLAGETRQADILIAAIGKAEFITADMVKDDVVIIDAGINFTSEGKLVGDVNEEAKAKASYASAVPGGVGVITVAELFASLCMLD